MNENMVEIGKDEYKALLEAKYDLSVVKDVLFSNAKLGYIEDGKLAFCMLSNDLDVVMNYLFRSECAKKIEELSKGVAGHEH